MWTSKFELHVSLIIFTLQHVRDVMNRRTRESPGEHRRAQGSEREHGTARETAGDRRKAQDSPGERRSAQERAADRRRAQESAAERRRAQKRAYTKKMVLEPPKSETFAGICKFYYSQNL